MERINNLVAVLTTFSSIAMSITAIIALLSMVFKPIRKGVSFVFNKIWEKKDNNAVILTKIENVESALSAKVDSLKSELSDKIMEVADKNDENEMDRIRWEILDFANSCRNGRRHTKDEYQHIIALNDKYLKMIESRGIINGVFEAEYEYIMHLYAERQEKNDFL